MVQDLKSKLRAAKSIGLPSIKFQYLWWFHHMKLSKLLEMLRSLGKDN